MVRILISAALTFLIFIVAFVATWNISLIVYPPFIIDKITGEKHRVMPIGHAIISIIVAALAGIIMLIFLMRRSKKNRPI